MAKLETIMLLRKVNMVVLWAGLLVVAGGTPCHSGITRADEGDLVNHIAKALPFGWSVDISSLQGKCFVDITTAPMETQASVYGSSFPGVKQMRLGVNVRILPRYTTDMLDRIKSHNKPVREELKALGGHKYSDKQQALKSKLIDEPMFYDRNYGFSVSCPSRVPSKPEDARKLMEVVETISSEWKSYDADKPDVLAELRRILTR
jgi:hypothetical protein